ncbi:NADH-quinone oxidoreductase subunit L [Chitinophaga nivalis]|uniref:NADH-quinone oxidoreductase subunit L n=1 Tax=Chitinophaga nivalis TaxID=2991709 RepID=A0ABT3IHQ0_9BACT|nr:NADH-quinone oxidoreductase subunit L [Chitinophaga nivalis]MCW3466853.1 NADH-quinone oxidoreductase subunit L [Chitinophaga nivalis]MCW3483456.1 NADH-quinone oxidoreductase subunit L [Chitinophaga nivalis]
MFPALIPAIPFLSACILMLCWRRIGRTAVTVVGCGSIALSALVALVIVGQLAANGQQPVVQHVWNWLQAGGFTAGIDLRIDALSAMFVLVITLVGFLIHVYATGYMADDPDYSRFFACMNLFVGAMLVLVMADNLLLLYFGWEGVGLCSYLLIGFWYKDPANNYAARKAFIVTRVGDTAMAIALFLLFQYTGTLEIPGILSSAAQQWTTGSPMVTLIACLLLGGAVGKSAQLPLQTWLPDAMAGPTPVSALIHAATMVTAGVYLLARTHTLFELAPDAQAATAIIGAVTLVLAGFSALVQTDIKRVLAYSTVSQIGYMFLALGCGAWSAAVFHFVTHAFFKALLFMSAGAIIVALHHEQDLFKMGGLKKQLKAVYWVFLIGAASLAAIPFVTAGFYSKDQIIWLAWSAAGGHPALWVAALLGALLTGMYTFRMFFLVFYGDAKTHVHHLPGKAMMIPLYILAVLSVVAGFVELPHTLGHLTLVTDWLLPVLPQVTVVQESAALEWLSQGISALLALSGIGLAYTWVIRRPKGMSDFLEMPALEWFRGHWARGWDFDRLYDVLLVHPFVYLSRVNRKDLVDRLYTGIARLMEVCHQLLARTQSGILRWYILGVVLGAVAILSVLIWRIYE